MTLWSIGQHLFFATPNGYLQRRLSSSYIYTIQFDDNKIIILFIYQVPVLTWIIIYRRLKPMSDAAKIIKNKLMFFFSEFCDTVLFVTN